MSVSEHANYLLNEYGRLQFDYAAYCKPYGESLRNEARNNLETYIAELEEENDSLQSAWFEEETICPDGSLKPKVSTLLSRIAELEAAQRWIPVSERLPEDGETVFVIIYDGFERFENGNEVARLTYLGNGNWWSWESERYVVTHWMPLPELPNDTQKDTVVYGKERER